MNKFSSIFGQILQVFDKRDFLQAVRDTKADRASKGFTCWDLWLWLDNPFEVPAMIPADEQLMLALR